ncbi:MAG: hypothetical protein M3Q34_04670 [bacterium]|nr:hypothetical protein [bacterium]
MNNDLLVKRPDRPVVVNDLSRTKRPDRPGVVNDLSRAKRPDPNGGKKPDLPDNPESLTPPVDKAMAETDSPLPDNVEATDPPAPPVIVEETALPVVVEGSIKFFQFRSFQLLNLINIDSPSRDNRDGLFFCPFS